VTRWLAACLVLAACERAPSDEPYHLQLRDPQVGDVMTTHLRMNGVLVGRDRERVARSDVTYSFEVTEVGHGDIVAGRFVVEHSDNVLDGKPLPEVHGTYLLRTDSRRVMIPSRPDGSALEPHERKFFESWHDAPTASDRAALNRISYRAGDHREPLRAEIRALSLGDPDYMHDVELTVDRSSARSMAFHTTYEMAAKESMPSGHFEIDASVTPELVRQTVKVQWHQGGRSRGHAEVESTQEMSRR
jgi:hypothetical protein